VGDSAVRAGIDRVALERAWRVMYESPAEARSVADACCAGARARSDQNFAARALALASAVEMHRGDFPAAQLLMDQARLAVGDAPAPRAAADIAAVSAQLAFFLGEYDTAIQQARHSLELSDASGDLAVQIRSRRMTCVVYGNLRLPDLRQRVEEQLALAIASDEPWEEAVSRNDLACLLFEEGDLDAAEQQTVRALRLLGEEGGGNYFAVAVIRSTRADIRLADGRAAEALADAEVAVRLLQAASEPDPYVLAATVRAQLQALMALGRPTAAHAAGLRALAAVGDQVPHTRSRLMLQLADAMRAAGLSGDADRTRSEAESLQRSEAAALAAEAAASVAGDAADSDDAFDD
jgi:hypothetical protein